MNNNLLPILVIISIIFVLIILFGYFYSGSLWPVHAAEAGQTDRVINGIPGSLLYGVPLVTFILLIRHIRKS